MNKHKKLFAILTLVCFLFTLMPMSAFAETEIIANGECGESAIWTLDSEGMLMISGTGVMYEYDFGEFPWSDRSSSIKEIIVEDGITTISGNAFYGCNNVEKVLLPESLETIGNDAFGFCEKLKEIVFPRNLKFIGDAAFYQCNSILELRIPRGLNALGDNPFYCMENLERITVESGNQNYYSDDAGTLISKDGVLIAFPANSDLEGYQVPDGVTVIGGRAFSKADNLQKIILPNGVAKICGEAFFQTDKLNELVFPETLRVVDIGAFDSCGLKEYNLPDGLEEIGDQAFRFCDSIQTLKIPASVTYIGYQPFAGCTNMPENILISNENDEFYVKNEALCEKLDNGIRLICAITDKEKYEIPAGITKIEQCAFLDCSNLRELHIPESVIQIGRNIVGQYGDFSNVYYAGSELDWKVIDIHKRNEGLLNAEIHYVVGLTDNPVSQEKSYIEVPSQAYATEEITLKFKFCDENGAPTTEKGSVYFWIEKEGKVFNDYGVGWSLQNGVDADTSYYNTQNNDICFGAEGVITNSSMTVGIGLSGEYTIYYSFTEPKFENGNILAPEYTKSHTITIMDNYICGENATWTLNTDGVLKIEGVGEVTERTWGSRRDVIKTIVVEEGITALPREAFARLDNLNKIELPASLEIVGVSLLQSSDNLTEIKVVDDNEIFYTIDNVLYQKAENSSDITLVAYPAGKTDKRFVVPDEVTVIGEGALSYCDNIEELIIGANVRQIVDIGVHYDSSNLNSIVVDDKNLVFYSKDGVLYQYGAEGDILVSYPNNRVEKSFVVPDGVVEIHEHAFIGDNNLEKLTLSEGVVALGEGCFEDCASLKKLYIPKNAVPIGSHIFAFSIVLEDIYYGGTEEEWNQSFGNEFVWENAVIHFNATDIPSGSNSGTDSGSSSSGGGSYYVPSTSTQTSDDITVNNTNADVRVETSDVKVSVIANAKNITSKNSKIDIIGGEGCAVSVSAKDKQGNALEGFFTPVTVKIPIDSDVLKTVDNISQLTLAKVVTDETGNTSLVYMGGSYDTQTGVFAAYADESGDYVLVEDADVKKIELQIGNRTTAINGMDKTSDVAPRIIDNHTYVPLRYIAEILGCDVAWDDVERTVTIKHANVTMKLVIDEKIDGYDVAAVIRENRTLVPLRYIAEQLGANVIWHPETQEIVVVK